MLMRLLFLTFAQAASGPSAKNTIEKFYRSYLDTPSITAKKPSPSFSPSFRALLKKDEETCKKYAGSDICGWGADGNVYLDAQEYDPHLTYRSSGIEITEAEPGKVKVNLNVYPSLKGANDSYKRSLVFVMVKTKGAWAVDDILSHGSSARKEMQEEIELYSKK